MKYRSKLLIFILACLLTKMTSAKKDQESITRVYENPEIRHSLRSGESFSPNQEQGHHHKHHSHNGSEHIRASDLLKNYRPMGHHAVGLWDDYNGRYKFKPNYTDGVKGHMWTPPLAAPPTAGVWKLASPKPPASNVPKKRIIADLIPPPTISKSVLDPPKRVDVLQIDLPTSTKKTIHYQIDPRTQLPPDVRGSSFHGIDPEKPTRHGVFLEKKETILKPAILGKSKNSPPVAKPKIVKKTAAQRKVDQGMGKLTSDALATARAVELKAKDLAGSVNAPTAGPGKLLIKIAMTNKRETPAVVLKTDQ